MRGEEMWTKGNEGGEILRSGSGEGSRRRSREGNSRGESEEWWWNVKGD